jgi:Lrp/AsnC family leucine-responsive transcriptional regulator
MVNLDVKDRRILLELDLFARKSDAQIARRVGLSKETTKYRIDRLLSSGAIKYFHTIIDITKLGFYAFRIFLKLQGISKAQERELIRYMIKNNKVAWFATCYGNWQCCIMVAVKSPEEFMSFWHEFYESFGIFFGDRHISQITHMWHFRRDYILPPKERPSPLVFGGYRDEKIDEKDLKILSIISRDGRASLSDIARRVGLTYKTVGARIADLEKRKIILGYRATLDLDKIGCKYYKVHFWLQRIDRKKLAAFSSLLAQSPYVFIFDEAIGGYDFEVEIEAPSDDEVVSIIDMVKTEFPELVRDYEIIRYVNEYKVDYLPVVV